MKLQNLIVPLLALSAVVLVDCSSTSKESAAPTGDWFQALRGSVLDEVEDPGRARRALAAIDQMDYALLVFVDASEGLSAQLQALNADYDATREEFEAVFAEMDAKRHETFETVRSNFAEFRAQIEPEEWSQIDFSQSLVEVTQASRH